MAGLTRSKPRRPLGRRDFLTRAWRLGAIAGVGHVMPWGLSERLFAQTPSSSERRLVRSMRPQDLETPAALLDSWITPNELHYVRSHLYTPSIDLASWNLSIDGDVDRPQTLTMADLRRLPSVSMPVTLECAGNGRAFFEPPVAGVQWQKGAVGNARWTGVRLADVLKQAGVVDAGGAGLLLMLDAALTVVDGRPLPEAPELTDEAPIRAVLVEGGVGTTGGQNEN